MNDCFIYIQLPERYIGFSARIVLGTEGLSKQEYMVNYNTLPLIHAVVLDMSSTRHIVQSSFHITDKGALYTPSLNSIEWFSKGNVVTLCTMYISHKIRVFFILMKYYSTKKNSKPFSLISPF